MQIKFKRNSLLAVFSNRFFLKKKKKKKKTLLNGWIWKLQPSHGQGSENFICMTVRLQQTQLSTSAWSNLLLLPSLCVIDMNTADISYCYICLTTEPQWNANDNTCVTWSKTVRGDRAKLHPAETARVTSSVRMFSPVDEGRGEINTFFLFSGI